MHSRQTIRPAYTLIELMVAMGSSAILMGGLASALCMSSQALVPDATATDEDNRSSLALAQATSDLRLALTFSERTARAVTFTVPDRNADAQVETIRYSWTGTAGDPLLYQYNGGAAVSIADNVQQFDVSALPRMIPADPLPVLPPSVEYHSFNEAKTPSAANSLTINAPAGVAAGNLLIAAVAVEDVFGNPLNTPAGWSLLNRLEYDSEVGLALWWKIAASSEPASYQFSWNDGRWAYGWIMRFSGAEPTAPTFIANSGNSDAVECLAMTTTVNNAMVLRVAAVDADDLTSSPSFHTEITRDDTDNRVTGAAAYRLLPIAGTTGTARFEVGDEDGEQFVTFTIVIAPDDGT